MYKPVVFKCDCGQHFRIAAIGTNEGEQLYWEKITKEYANRMEGKMDRSHCTGCEDDFYNDHNHMAIKECWNLKTAHLVMKKQVGMDDVPPWDHTPRNVPNCYHKQGFIFVDENKTH